MAKGARASVRKANNTRLKQNVFGPVENARVERLSAKLLELASQPKPKPAEEDADITMATEEGATEATSSEHPTVEDTLAQNMEIDGDAGKDSAPLKSSKRGRVEKRRYKSSRKASIVFPKFKNGKKVKPSREKK